MPGFWKSQGEEEAVLTGPSPFHLYCIYPSIQFLTTKLFTKPAHIQTQTRTVFPTEASLLRWERVTLCRSFRARVCRN